MLARNLIACTVVVGCGSSPQVDFDAGPADATPDTLGVSSGMPPADAVAITITQTGLPVAGLPIYFQNADSSVVLATKSDAGGVAWANLGEGGFVTVIEPPDGTGATPIATFAAVAPKDRLRLDLMPVAAPPLITVDLQVPLASAAGYLVHNSCGDTVGMGTNSSPVTLLDCGNGVIDLVIEPLDADGDTPFGAIYAPGTPVADGKGTSIVGSYAPLVAVDFTYSRVPATIASIGTYGAILTSRGRPFDTTVGDAAASVVTDHFALPAMLPDATMLTVTDELPVDTELGAQAVYDWRPVASTYALDLTTTRLPGFTGAPMYNPATHAITWMERVGGVEATVVSARVHAYRDDIPSGRAWTWRITAPKTGVSVTLPKLPDDGFDYNPTDADAPSVDDLTTALVPGGYPAIRAHAFAPLPTAIAGASGQLIVQTQYAPNL